MSMSLHDELRLPDGRAADAVVGMLADVGLATAALTRLPADVVATTLSTTIDHVGTAPSTGELVAVCQAESYAGGPLLHAVGTVCGDDGRVLARISGWLVLTATQVPVAPAHELSTEWRGQHLLDLLEAQLLEQGPDRVVLRFAAREQLSNLVGTLHGGVGAMACEAAAQMCLGTHGHLLTSTLAYLRPVPETATVTVVAEVLRRGRRTALVRSRLTDAAGVPALEATVVAGVALSPGPA